MAIYNSRFNSAGGAERREIQSQLILDATGAADPLSIGWSQGFIRRQNTQNQAVTAGGGIFDALSDLPAGVQNVAAVVLLIALVARRVIIHRRRRS